MSTAPDEATLLAKAKSILDHLSAGGTLKTVVNLSDQELEAVYAVAYNNFNARKFEEAADLFRFLCLYDHTEPRWAYGLGVVEQQRKNYDAAVNAYALATVLDVDDPRPQAQAGYCLMAKEAWPEAVSALEGAVMAAGSDPRHAGVREQAESLLATARTRLAASGAKPAEKGEQP